MNVGSGCLPWTATKDTHHPLILAPMAGISHGAFRRLVEETAPFDLYFSEMISAGPLLSQGRFETYYTDSYPAPHRVVYQLLSPRADLLVAAAGRLAELRPGGIDVNFGCSAPEVVRNGGGIAWLRRPEEALEALRGVASAITPLPLSVKLRLPEGYRPETMEAFLSALPESGVAAVTIHPRHQRQSYSRPSHRSILNRLAAASPIPVVASGDICDRSSFDAVRRIPGIAGTMIGRGAIARPWITRVLRGTNGESVPRWELAKRFFGLLESYQPEEFWVSRSRRFLTYFLGAVPFGRRLAAQLQEESEYPTIRREAVAFLRRQVPETSL
ncbi:MAG: tRNA dihydrouridine synthase [Spirochaetota bacterium]